MTYTYDYFISYRRACGGISINRYRHDIKSNYWGKK